MWMEEECWDESGCGRAVSVDLGSATWEAVVRTLRSNEHVVCVDLVSNTRGSDEVRARCDETLDVLRGKATLRAVSLWGMPHCLDAVAQFVASEPGVRSLTLMSYETRLISDGALAAIQGSRLEHCALVDGASPLVLAALPGTLRHLSTGKEDSWAANVHDPHEVDLLAARLHALDVLEVGAPNPRELALLCPLLRAAPRLHHLTLRHLEGVRDSGALGAALCNPALRHIELHGYGGVRHELAHALLHVLATARSAPLLSLQWRDTWRGQCVWVPESRELLRLLQRRHERPTILLAAWHLRTLLPRNLVTLILRHFIWGD